MLTYNQCKDDYRLIIIIITVIIIIIMHYSQILKRSKIKVPFI